MNDTARKLRAQMRFSTDPAWLERMAREVESTAGAAAVNADAVVDAQYSLDLAPPARASQPSTWGTDG